jgi:GNAT superfamily N-acetyltransferase
MEVRSTLNVRLGDLADVDAAISVYLRSDLERRQGRRISDERMAEVRETLRAPTSWFFIAEDGAQAVAMACAMPAREDAGAGPLIAAACYLDLLFVVPERWGEGIGGTLLDAVLDDAARRGYSRIQLWTHDNNDRAHGLYRSRGFAPAPDSHLGNEGVQVREWARDIEPQ